MNLESSQMSDFVPVISYELPVTVLGVPVFQYYNAN